MTNILKVKKLHPNAIIPTKANDGDLGWDLYCLYPTAFTVYTHENAPVLIETGIACEFPEGYGAIIKDRSGMASKKQLTIHAGVIDNGYTGEIKILMYYHGDKFLNIEAGTKIAQMVLVPVVPCVVEVVDEIVSSDGRGHHGFGSTG